MAFGHAQIVMWNVVPERTLLHDHRCRRIPSAASGQHTSGANPSEFPRLRAQRDHDITRLQGLHEYLTVLGPDQRACKEAGDDIGTDRQRLLLQHLIEAAGIRSAGVSVTVSMNKPVSVVETVMVGAELTWQPPGRRTDRSRSTQTRPNRVGKAAGQQVRGPGDVVQDTEIDRRHSCALPDGAKIERIDRAVLVEHAAAESSSIVAAA